MLYIVALLFLFSCALKNNFHDWQMQQNNNQGKERLLVTCGRSVMLDHNLNIFIIYVCPVYESFYLCHYTSTERSNFKTYFKYQFRSSNLYQKTVRKGHLIHACWLFWRKTHTHSVCKQRRALIKMSPQLEIVSSAAERPLLLSW